MVSIHKSILPVVSLSSNAFALKKQAFGLQNEGWDGIVLRMRLQIKQYTDGPLMCNGYLVISPEGACVAIDAPAGFADWLRHNLPENAKVTHLFLTHQHFDHVSDAEEMASRLGCEIHACSPYAAELTLQSHARSWGIPEPPRFRVNRCHESGDGKVQVGGMEWTFLHVPGHSPDSLAWYLAQADVVFTGDALFAGSVGRTDLPGGSSGQLVRSIREKLLSLPPNTELLPGHGPSSFIGEEEMNNPFLS